MRVSSACGLALAAGLAGCSLDPIDYKGKGCPCLADLTCQIVPRQCIVAPGAPQPSLGCVIYTDGMLYCGNASGSQMRSAPRASAPVVDTLRTSYSWFICWGTGELHAGGNTTWYYTEGDDAGRRGWLPAVNLDTPGPFNADPAAYGFAGCGP
ncbi:MAG TPA: hypothetical protein VKE22_11145 [Haliangiales bacterium]|nr:hypothetical protein [Haliangiales bacterium]